MYRVKHHIAQKKLLYGTETFSYLGPRILNLFPFDVKDYATEQMFRQKIRKWKPDR